MWAKEQDGATEPGLAQAAGAEKPKAAAHKDKPGEEQHKQGSENGMWYKPLATPAHTKEEYLGVFPAQAMERSPAPHPSALAGHQAALQANKIGEPQSSSEKASEGACACACKQC